MAISRTNFTRQYEHVAVIAHGAHPEYRLEFDAAVKDEDASKGIYQGSVVSLDSNGQFVIGCGVGTGVNYPVPCISMKNVADPDVTAGVVGTDYRTSVYSAIGGKITAIPCTGGYQIETTEFDQSVTYAPNDALTPATGAESGTAIAKGKLKKLTAQPFQAAASGTPASEPIVGFVSKAAYTANNYHHKRLSFFTNFIPVAH